MTRLLRFMVFAALAACHWSDPVFTVFDGGSRDGSADARFDANTLVDGDLVIRPTSVCSGRAPSDAGSGVGSGLLAWYRCESVSGTTLPDSSGSGNHGVLASGSGAASGPVLAQGKIGSGLDLVFANKGYIRLPSGLLANLCEATIATWVNVNSNTNAWTRIWDFGQDTQTYMFLTPITNTDNISRFGITTLGNQFEETLKGLEAVPTKVWVHIAVVLGSQGGSLYLNGEVVATNPGVTLRPADLGRTVNNFIGRSQFSDDPYLDASIDEFRVYDRALSADEIRILATVH